MGLSSTPGVPHKGWTLLDVIDLRDDEGREYGDYDDCEFCDHEQIRYVHVIEHAAYPGPLRVGCDCACRLTEDYRTPRARERALRSRSARRSRFPGRRWRRTKIGSEMIKLDGYRVTVGRVGGDRFRVWIDGVGGVRTYPASTPAKLAAFDAVEQMKARAARSRALSRN